MDLSLTNVFQSGMVGRLTERKRKKETRVFLLRCKKKQRNRESREEPKDPDEEIEREVED